MFSIGRTLLMLQSIKRAHQLDANNPDLHTCLVRFLQHIGANTLEGPVADVVKRQTSGIFSNFNAAELNSEFLSKNRKSLPHLLQGARMLHLLDSSAQAKALSLASQLDGFEGVNLETCTRVLEALRNEDFGLCEQAIADYTTKCEKRFPYATAFRPPESYAQTTNHQAAVTTIGDVVRE